MATTTVKAAARPRAKKTTASTLAVTRKHTGRNREVRHTVPAFVNMRDIRVEPPQLEDATAGLLAQVVRACCSGTFGDLVPLPIKTPLPMGGASPQGDLLFRVDTNAWNVVTRCGWTFREKDVVHVETYGEVPGYAEGSLAVAVLGPRLLIVEFREYSGPGAINGLAVHELRAGRRLDGMAVVLLGPIVKLQRSF